MQRLECSGLLDSGVRRNDINWVEILYLSDYADSPAEDSSLRSK